MYAFVFYLVTKGMSGRDELVNTNTQRTNLINFFRTN